MRRMTTPAIAPTAIATSLLIALALASCATPATTGRVATLPPPALTGEALALARAMIAQFDGPTGPSQLHGSPGSATMHDGTVVHYDRYLLVGSSLQKDRAREFDAFVEELTKKGGVYFCVEMRDGGNPTKILFVADGKRVMTSTLQW
jgi:hypothetical protein